MHHVCHACDMSEHMWTTSSASFSDCVCVCVSVSACMRDAKIVDESKIHRAVLRGLSLESKCVIHILLFAFDSRNSFVCLVNWQHTPAKYGMGCRRRDASPQSEYARKRETFLFRLRHKQKNENNFLIRSLDVEWLCFVRWLCTAPSSNPINDAFDSYCRKWHKTDSPTGFIAVRELIDSAQQNKKKKSSNCSRNLTAAGSPHTRTRIIFHNSFAVVSLAT